MKKQIILTNNGARGHQRQEYFTTIHTRWYLGLLLLALFMAGCKKDEYKTETQSIPTAGNNALPAKPALPLAVNYVITLSSNPGAGGKTSGAGAYTSGSSVTVKATAASGYVFLNWTNGGKIVSASRNFIFIIKKSRTLVANFEVLTAGEFGVTILSNPEAGGKTSGGGAYKAGSSVTAKATADSGYVFLNWTSGGKIVSTSRNFTFIIKKSRALVANFEVLTAGEFGVTLLSSPGADGRTTGGGVYNAGSEVTIIAKAHPGHIFLNWTSDGDIVSTSPTLTFIINKNRTLVANFN